VAGLRVVGDTVYSFEAIRPGWFVLGRKTGWSLAGKNTNDQRVDVPLVQSVR